MTIISLHHYKTDPLLPQKDGVNLAHENITALLEKPSGLPLGTEFHDLNQLLTDRDYARHCLSGVDVVVSNVGPHAHYYFWLRDQLGLEFRIARDVRTAIWSSYLLQEHLCRPYLRAGDSLIFASNYCWALYVKMFPWLANYPTSLCYPLSIGFPDQRPLPNRRAHGSSDITILGYLGRLSDDKNFHDVLELLTRLNGDPRRSRTYKLLACGDIHSPRYAPDVIHEELRKDLACPEAVYEYLPARPNHEIWDLLTQFDVMVFPSTSNLETFGRVLIEASFCRLPVVAGAHAAAPELIDPRGLCRVDYHRNTVYESHFDYCLGRVDIAEMQAAITSAAVQPSDCYTRYRNHPEQFLQALLEPALAGGPPALSPVQRDFIDGLTVALPAPLTRSAAGKTIALLADWFVGLQRIDGRDWSERVRRLGALTKHPARTERFIARSEASKGDFTNVGGVDIELCHLIGFYPSFRLN